MRAKPSVADMLRETQWAERPAAALHQRPTRRVLLIAPLVDTPFARAYANGKRLFGAREPGRTEPVGAILRAAGLKAPGRRPNLSCSTAIKGRGTLCRAGVADQRFIAVQFQPSDEGIIAVYALVITPPIGARLGGGARMAASGLPGALPSVG